MSFLSPSKVMRRPAYTGIAFVVTLMAFAVAGCGGGGGFGIIPTPIVTPSISLSVGTLNFGTLTTGASAAQSVTVTNTGTVAATISAVVLGGANASTFSETDNCKGALAAGANCAIAVTFASGTAGTFAGTVTVSSNAIITGPQSVALSGTASTPPPPAPVAVLSATSQIFAAMTAGTTSVAQTVTLMNTGAAPLVIGGAALSGTGANLFQQTNNCPTSLAVGSVCTFSFVFGPKVAGSYSATLTVTDNATPSTQTVTLAGTATPGLLTIDTTNPADWKIANGAMTFDFNTTKARVSGIFINGYPDNLVDNTANAPGIYMDNTGLGAATGVPGYSQTAGYIDFYITYPSNAANAYTYSEHYVVFPNDPGIHLYISINHSATDIAGSIGQIQYVYRSNLNDFTNTYTVNGDLSNPGPVKVPVPPYTAAFSDPGRAVSDATVDVHGLPLPAGFTRGFYTKYDYGSYQYLHQAHGTYGSTYGNWAYFPSSESLVGGPTKQYLIYTGNLLIVEANSNHLVNPLSFNTPAGTATNRLFGPYYIHFNTFGQAINATGNALKTPDDMYADTLAAGAAMKPLYDTDATLVAAGYVPSVARGSVSVQVGNVASSTPKTAWAVLSDPATNVQFSNRGGQYWADVSSTGTANFTGVMPGTYRLSVYVLGQWGELRQENVVVKSNATTTVPTSAFVQENFGTGTPVFTIGTADRSAHEFLHGHDSAGHDDREFYGAWNYWADFQANLGAVVYNATSGPAGAATNDLSQWNYVHWGTFNPGLFGGVYNAADDTTDGYKYVVPAYVTAPATQRVPAWTVHFATPASQSGTGAQAYAVLSVSLACTEGSYVVSLNGQQLIWHSTNASDCMIRSGLSGFTQWFALQWDASVLAPAGQDNVLSIGVSQNAGVSEDALRLELTNMSADPAVRGWNDYEFIYKSVDTKPNDAVPNP